MGGPFHFPEIIINHLFSYLLAPGRREMERLALPRKHGAEAGTEPISLALLFIDKRVSDFLSVTGVLLPQAGASISD